MKQNPNTKISRRAFSQWLAGAAALGLVERADAARLLGRDEKRLSWRAHRTAGAEGYFELTDIDGELPADLVGTLYRTAPGESERFGVPFQHLFDGDAFVSGFSFRDGKVALRARFLDQPARVEEQEKGQMIYSEFGTRAPGDGLRRDKNQPSVNIVPWQDQLLGLSEGGHPTAIDPKTLRYRGTHNFAKTLPGAHSFTAHPKFDPATGEGYAYGIKQGPGMALNVYRMQTDGKLEWLHSLPQPGYFMVHDMMLTKDHIVFLIPPVTYDLMALFSGKGSIADCLRYAEDSPLRVLILRKDGEGEPQTIPLDASMVFHHGNAFVDDGILNLDTFLTADRSVLRMLHSWSQDRLPNVEPVQATRLRLDLEKGELVGRSEFGQHEEFPRFDERATGTDARYLYAAGGADDEDPFAFRATVRHDRHRGGEIEARCGKNQTVAEPVFVPRGAGDEAAAETDGWVLRMGYDGPRDETFLDVLAADSLDRIARIWAGTHIPLGFHGNFVRGMFVEK